MRLSSTIDALLNRIQSAQTEQIQLISKLLGLKIGDEFFAQAQKITQPTDTERKQLIDFITSKLVQLNKNSVAPAVQEQIKQFNELLKLLQKPQLTLVDLKIVTAKSEQRLLTYTDQPIKINQEILLKINTKQQLELVFTRTNTNGAKDTIAQKESIIGENLRQLLPRQNTATDLLIYLPKLLQVIQKLPALDRKNILLPAIQNALIKIANQIPTASQLIRPDNVKLAMKNNGTLFERHLVTELKPGSIQDVKPRIEHLIERDRKGALLHLLAQLEKELPKAHQGNQTTPLNNLLSKAPTTTGLDLLQWLSDLDLKQQPSNSQLNNAQLDIKHLRNQLMLLLHQYTLSSLTKIQLQQIHALTNQTETQDSVQTIQSWQLEIPIRQGTEIQLVQMKMDQYWVDDKEESATKTNSKERQWNILLSFNLVNAGQFDAQLILLRNQLSARFWVDKIATLQRVKDKMDVVKTQLEKEGFNLVKLECLPGKSPQPKMTLSYSLVDIKT